MVTTTETDATTNATDRQGRAPLGARLCWIDVRGAGEATAAVLQEAAHQRIDGVLSTRVDDLAVLPPTVTRVLLVEGGDVAALDALEGGTVDVVITDGAPDGIRDKVAGAELGVLIRVVDAESLTAACDATREHPWVVIEFKDPTKIPLEIVLAAAHGAAGRIITRVADAEEAGIVFDVLEHGSDGVLLTASTPGQATALRQTAQGGMPALDLVELSVVGIAHVGLGDRVCVDTCTYFAEDEGILVGSTSKGFVLTCSETHPLPYMPTRPFRSNAGAVHSYTLVTAERTNYLTELRAGSKVLAVNASGRTRQVVVGRSKIESRPLLSIDLTAPDGRPVNIIVQDDWHVRLLGPGATVLNVTELVAGDRVLGHLPTADRHVGYAIDEFCIEQWWGAKRGGVGTTTASPPPLPLHQERASPGRST